MKSKIFGKSISLFVLCIFSASQTGLAQDLQPIRSADQVKAEISVEDAAAQISSERTQPEIPSSAPDDSSLVSVAASQESEDVPLEEVPSQLSETDPLVKAQNSILADVEQAREIIESIFSNENVDTAVKIVAAERLFSAQVDEIETVLESLNQDKTAPWLETDVLQIKTAIEAKLAEIKALIDGVRNTNSYVVTVPGVGRVTLNMAALIAKMQATYKGIVTARVDFESASASDLQSVLSGIFAADIKNLDSVGTQRASETIEVSLFEKLYDKEILTQIGSQAGDDVLADLKLLIVRLVKRYGTRIYDAVEGSAVKNLNLSSFVQVIQGKQTGNEIFNQNKNKRLELVQAEIDAVTNALRQAETSLSSFEVTYQDILNSLDADSGQGLSKQFAALQNYLGDLKSQYPDMEKAPMDIAALVQKVEKFLAANDPSTGVDLLALKASLEANYQTIKEAYQIDIALKTSWKEALTEYQQILTAATNNLPTVVGDNTTRVLSGEYALPSGGNLRFTTGAVQKPCEIRYQDGSIIGFENGQLKYLSTAKGYHSVIYDPQYPNDFSKAHIQLDYLKDKPKYLLVPFLKTMLWLKDAQDAPSTEGHAIQVLEGVSLDAADSALGGESFSFDGVGDGLSLEDSEDWNFGTGDFTIESRIRMSELPEDGKYYTITSQFADSSNFWQFSFYSADGSYYLTLDAYSGGEPDISIIRQISESVNANTWHHVAVERSGNEFRCYFDGVQQGAVIVSESSMGDKEAVLKIGSFNAQRLFKGDLDELRITKGATRWTGDFTPETVEYERDANTTLLFHCSEKEMTEMKEQVPLSSTPTVNYPTNGETAVLDTQMISLLLPDQAVQSQITVPEKANEILFKAPVLPFDIWSEYTAALNGYIEELRQILK